MTSQTPQYNLQEFITEDYIGLRLLWNKMIHIKTIIFCIAFSFIVVIFLYRKIDMLALILWFCFSVFFYLIIVSTPLVEISGLQPSLYPFSPHLGLDAVSMEVRASGVPFSS